MEFEERAADLFAGGIAAHGYQCGMLWGAALAAGAQAYRLFGPGSQAESAAMIAAQRLVESFRARNKYIDCLEITDLDLQGQIQARQIVKFFVKGQPISCIRMAAEYAHVAFGDINAALSENRPAPSPPVSCSAMLARKMGASDVRAVMAAGLAGGIGLSGGACGALGAAIWIIGMNNLKQGTGTIELDHPRVHDVMDRFMKCTDYEFECSKIAGRRFEDIGDHAGYLRDGGCSNIIQALVAPGN
jgi:Putative redox-active protein (C_GCAxxG_C_C)